MPRNPAPEKIEQPQDHEEPSEVTPTNEFDPSTVKVGNIKDPDKIRAKIDAARLKHEEASNPNPIEDQPPAPPVQVIERRIETVTVEIPLGEPLRHFQYIHVEGRLTKENAQTWARFRQALRDKGAKTADGKEIESEKQRLDWLMEKFASEC